MNKKRISWAITMHCNAHPCKYCISKSNSNINHPSLEDILLIINNINLLGSWEIYINGGEPFSIPHFIDIIIPKLLTTDNDIFVTSNFSYDNSKYIDFIDITGNNLLKLNLSYHHQLFPDYMQFVKKIENLISSGCPQDKIVVSAVLNPDKLLEIKELDGILDDLGIYLYPQFIKMRNNDGSLSPYEYNNSQLNIISKFDKGKKQKSFPLNTSDLECWAGTNYLFVTPDGNAYRCQQYYYREEEIGNFKKAGFQLLEQAVKCDFEYCSCGSAQQVCIKEKS